MQIYEFLEITEVGIYASANKTNSTEGNSLQKEPLKDGAEEGYTSSSASLKSS